MNTLADVPHQFLPALNAVIAQEGGWKFTNHPNDPGGMTFGGMTYATFKDWAPKLGFGIPDPASFEAAAHEPGIDASKHLQYQIAMVYKAAFWDKMLLDEILWSGWPRVCLFSAAVNLGLGEAVEIVQHTVGVKADGVFGPATKQAILALPSSGIVEQRFKQHWRLKYAELVHDNAEAWVEYAFALGNAENPGAPTPIEPRYKRFEQLAGWLNRVESISG